MTKRKKMVRRSSPRRTFKKSSSKRKSQGLTTNDILISSAIYGAGRGTVAGLIRPITEKLPIPQATDEVGLAIGAWFLAKKAKSKMLKNIGKVALATEVASLSEGLIGGSIDMLTGSQTSAAKSVGFPV